MLKVIVNCVILSSYTSKIDDLNIENYKLSYLSHVFLSQTTFYLFLGGVGSLLTELLAAVEILFIFISCQ